LIQENKTIGEIKMVLISEQLNNAFNAQIGEEISSAYIYLSMSTWLKEHSFNNLGEWFFEQYNEELAHAYKFMDYIVETGGTVKLPEIPAPKNDWANVEEIVKTAYKHEQYITNKIRELVILAEELRDYGPRELLTWFVSEQIEEEASTSELVDRQAAFKSDMLLDQHTTRTQHEDE
jgi:ferritin